MDVIGEPDGARRAVRPTVTGRQPQEHRGEDESERRLHETRYAKAAHRIPAVPRVRVPPIDAIRHRPTRPSTNHPRASIESAQERDQRDIRI